MVETVQSRSIKLKYIPSPIDTHQNNPHLRYIKKAHILLESDKPEDSWLNLYKKVKPYNNGLELSNNIRSVVLDYVLQKIPNLKERIPSFKDLESDNMLNALANNWFETVSEIEGQRKEVLLASMAHIVKRIETHTYAEILKNATAEELNSLGLNSSLRDLTIELLNISTKLDPLYVRFKAFSHLTRKPPKEASATTYFLPGDPIAYTFSSLFPKESRYLTEHFQQLATSQGEWQKENGGSQFQNYLLELAKLYREHDPEKAAKQQEEVVRLYGELLKTNFPVIVTPATDVYTKEPYLDPEIRISIATIDSQQEEEKFKKAKIAMAESLDIIEAQKFKEDILNIRARTVIAIGSYGVNLTFASVAQENPQILLYLNEQERAYDRDFYQYMDLISNTQQEFSSLTLQEKQKRIEFMSRTNTIFHEDSHPIYPDGSEESKRLGGEPLTTIDEVKAEILFRPLIPSIIEKGGLEGTKEQWAIGMLATSLQYLHDQAEDDPYFHAGVYTLNNLFKEGVVIYDKGKFTIKNFDDYYEIMRKNASEIMSVYEQNDMNEHKARKWIKTHSQPNGQVQRARELVKSLIE